MTHYGRMILCFAIALALAPSLAWAVESAQDEGDASSVVQSQAVYEGIESGDLVILTNEASGKALDVLAASSANAANVQQYGDNNSPAQRFRVESAGDGFYYLVNVSSGKVLDVANGQASSGANVQQFENNGSAAQKWRFVADGSGEGFYVVSALSSNPESLDGALVLDVDSASAADGANVQLFAYNGSAAQRFGVTAIEQTVADGIYTVASSLSASMVLDVDSASTADAANVQLYTANGTLAQKFKVAYDASSGYYTLQNAYSCKVLDVVGGSSSWGANVQQYSSNATTAQLWSIEGTEGSYTLRSACSGLALDVVNGDASNGVNVQVWETNGSGAQKWDFVETQLVDDGLYQVASCLGTVLDAASGGTTAGTNVQAYAANGSQAQKYMISYKGSGFYAIECANSGLVLDVASGVGPNVQLWEDNGSDAQLWKAIAAGEGRLTFENKATGLVLDVAAGSSSSGANVQVYASNGTSAQQWLLESADPLAEGLYTIVSMLDEDMVLDIESGSTSNGALLQLYEGNGTAAQKFRLVSEGDGLYRVVNLGSNKSLDVKDLQLDADSGYGVVQQWESWSTDAQMWFIEYAGDGSFTLYSQVDDGTSCLDVSGAGTTNGTSVDVYGGNGTNAQKFKFEDAGSVEYVQYDITIDEMFGYQRSGNPYLSSVSDDDLYDALSTTATGTSMYQFVDLREYTGLTGSQLDAYIETYGSEGVLAGMGWAFAEAAQDYGLNEAYLVAHTCIESSWGTSRLASGTYYNGEGYNYLGNDGNWYWAELSGYPEGTYYNLFGIGAYDSDPYKGGIETAIEEGWDSVEDAVSGAAEWIASSYVYSATYAQPTLYDMKWDVARSNAIRAYGWHQYATSITWATSIASLMNSCYAAAGVPDPNLLYRIPQYA